MRTAQPIVPNADAGAPPFALFSLQEVIRLTGMCRTTIYDMVRKKTFPAPVRLGCRRVAWRQTDLERWNDGLQTGTADPQLEIPQGTVLPGRSKRGSH